MSDPTDDELLVVRAVGAQFRPTAVSHHALSPDQVEAILMACDTPGSRHHSAWPARDSAAIEVLARCGSRAGELCGLEVRDFDLSQDRPIMRIVRGSKGGRRRDVPVPARTCAAVKKYLQERISRWEGCEAPAEPAPTAPLFVRNNGVAFDVSFLDRMVRRLASSASVSLPRDAAAHALRHHLGVQLALRNTPVPVIQQILGHADSRTTAVYTSIASSGLADALDEAGWL